jgi:hypothetical protein
MERKWGKTSSALIEKHHSDRTLGDLPAVGFASLRALRESPAM